MCALENNKIPAEKVLLHNAETYNDYRRVLTEMFMHEDPSPGFGVSDIIGRDVADGVIKAMKKKGVI